jgi:peroxiredoxin
MWDVCPIKVGQEVPDSKLLNSEGDTLSLSKVIEGKKIVLVFFRGGWCPYCTKHLKALQEVQDEIKEAGFEMIAITVDNVKNSNKVVSKKDLDYLLFSDVNGTTIDNFGISFQLPEETIEKYKKAYMIDLAEKSIGGHTKLPVPAVFFIQDNKVTFEYVNPDYKQRLSPEMVIGMLK